MNKMSPSDIEKTYALFPLSSYLLPTPLPCLLPSTAHAEIAGKNRAGSLSKIGNETIDSTAFQSGPERPALATKAHRNIHGNGLISDSHIAHQSHSQHTSSGALPSPVKQKYSTPKHRSGAKNLSLLNRTRQDCIMYLIVNADCVAQLRHVVMETCGECVAFIRIQPIAHATRMKVWLGLSKPAVCQIMASVMSSLPGAEFGQVMPFER